MSILKQWIKIILECQYSCRSTERSMLPIAILISSTLHGYLKNAAYIGYRINTILNFIIETFTDPLIINISY